MPVRYWALIFVLGIGWGSSMFFNEILLRELGPFQTGLGRVGFGALGCWLWLAASGRTGRVSPAFLRDAAIFGLLQYAVPLTIFPAAQQVITSGEAGIINALTPVMVVIVSHLWPGGERATWLKSLGVAAGFAGIVTLALPALGQGGGGAFGALLFCMLAPFCYGLAVNWFRRFGRTDPAVITAWSLLAGTLALLPVVLMTEGMPVINRPATWGALFFIGFVLTAASFILLFWLSATGGGDHHLDHHLHHPGLGGDAGRHLPRRSVDGCAYHRDGADIPRPSSDRRAYPAAPAPGAARQSSTARLNMPKARDFAEGSQPACLAD